MSQQKNVNDLFNEGVEAYREGDRMTARLRFEQVVELDPNSEKGWFWLASVLTDDADRRDALQRVLALNPNNERAQKALERITAREQDELVKKDEVVAGVDRRQAMLIFGGGAAIAILLLVFLLISTISNNARIAAEEAGTANAIVYMTNTAVEGTNVLVVASQTAFATITPPTEVFIPRVTLPPTWTPAAEATSEADLRATGALAPPQGLSGTLVGWGGRDVLNIGFLPVGVFDLNTGAFREIGTGLVQSVDIAPSGQRILYTEYDEVLFGVFLEAVNLNATQPEVINNRWRGYPAINPTSAQYSGDESKVILIAEAQDAISVDAFQAGQLEAEANTQVYLLDLNAPPPPTPDPALPTPETAVLPTTLRRLTNDGAIYRDVTISRNGTQAIAVRNDIMGAQPGDDLVLIDVPSGTITPITSDYTTFSERNPRFLPDGAQFVYAAASANDPDNFDIVLRPANSPAALPRVILSDPASEIYPVPSPDGRYVAFASNRLGGYDIYIYEFATGTTYQLTNTVEDEFPGGWWQPQ